MFNFVASNTNFMDVDTIIPAMMIDSGGTSMHVGLMTGILLGINSRVFSLLALAILFWFSGAIEGDLVIGIIFILISIFSVSGAFANISYTDILGKSVLPDSRKSYFSIRQAISSIGMFVSAFLAARVLSGPDYPLNYSTLFGIAALALGIATLGFWNLREVAALQTIPV